MPAHRKWRVDDAYRDRGKAKIPLILQAKDMYTRGLKPKYIAEELEISVPTVHRYINAPVDDRILRDTPRAVQGRKKIYQQPRDISRVRKTDIPYYPTCLCPNPASMSKIFWIKSFMRTWLFWGDVSQRSARWSPEMK